MPELELHTLLTHIGWSEDDERYKVLMELRSQANGPVWWSQYQLPEAMNKLVGFESIALKLRVYEAAFVFGPLQTREYARAVIRGLTGDDEDTVEKKVQLRIDRQQRIYQIPNPPTLELILDETVLRRNVGGPEVMADQLEFLAGLTSPCELRILPLNRGAHPGMMGSFWLFTFPPNMRKPSVYMDGGRKNLYLDDEASVTHATVDFVRLWELASSPAKSHSMLLKVAEEARERCCVQTGTS